MKLVDANVLLYAINRAEPRQPEAAGWLDEALSGTESVGFAWTVLLAFLRIATHPAIFPEPLDVVAALEVMESWLAAPSALVVEPTGRHLSVLAGLIGPPGTGGNLIPDAHLAALAVEHAATVVTYDRDFGRFQGVRWVSPVPGGQPPR